MRNHRLHLTLIGLLIALPPALGQDLAAIKREIGREPAYHSKSVRYCLLVFGHDAAVRVWLVQDGGILYVDRNANGDLTEADEKVKATPGDHTNPEEGVYYFEAGDIRAGGLTHKDLTVTIGRLENRRETLEGVKDHLAKFPGAR